VRFNSIDPTSTVSAVARDIFLLDEQLHLQHHSLSPLLARNAVWLSSLLPYAQAAEVLARIGGYQIPATSLWEHTQHVGQIWLSQQQKRHVGVERTRWETERYQPQLRKSVGMDGGMVHVRGEGWKELKVGVIGTFMPPWALAEPEQARSQELHYTAHLGGVETFAAELWQLAVQQQVPYAGQVVVTADGAPWIWRLAADLFPCSTQIVDWYHASQQLASLAQSHCSDSPQAAQAWSEALKRCLWRGECWQVIAQLRAAGVPNRYFEDHQRRMDYPGFRAEGYPIGSGTTESGVKQYKQRLCGAGMRWSRSGIDRMVVLRSAVMAGAFDLRWAAA
jgi:hypothetical protein